MNTAELDMTPRYAPTTELFQTSRGFRYLRVEQAISYPPHAHPKECPLVQDCTAIELRNGDATRSRWYGCQEARITSELRLVVIGTPSRDEVRMRWPVCDEA